MTFPLSPPGSFSLAANPAFENEAADELARISACTREQTHDLPVLGLLLTGSFSRGEGTIVADAHATSRWLSDVECLVVYASDRRSQSHQIDETVLAVQDDYNRKPDSRRRGLKLELSATPVDRLRRVRASIFAHELFEHGKLLWGTPEAIVVDRGSADKGIPIRDAFRLLNNRIIEQLEARLRFESDPVHNTEAAAYAICKFWLDLATSLSIFLGCYESRYRVREAALQKVLASRGGLLDADFRRMLMEKVREATEAKFGERPIPTQAMEQSFSCAAEGAWHVWEWESAWLLDTAPGENWRSVFQRLRRLEPARQRARDWARLLIRPDRRVYRNAPIMAQALRCGSLANVVYGCGYLLNRFWLELGQDSGEANHVARTVARLLNVKTPYPAGPPLRRQLATRVIGAWERHLRFAPA